MNFVKMTDPVSSVLVFIPEHREQEFLDKGYKPVKAPKPAAKKAAAAE